MRENEKKSGESQGIGLRGSRLGERIVNSHKNGSV